MEKIGNKKAGITIVFLSLALLGWAVFFASSLVVPQAQAKPAGVTLQEGLYAEEMEGDLDRAIEIYNQIINDSSAEESYVAKAMYRLGMCYLKKHDESRARETFLKLVADFAEQTSIIEKVQPLLEEISSTDPAALMPVETKIYVELGSPGKQLETILNMLKGTPFENPLAVIGRGQPGQDKSPGDVMAALMNPSMIKEFKKIRGLALGFVDIPVNVSNPRAVAVLYPGKSDALRGILLAAFGMIGKTGEPVEGMQSFTIQDSAGIAYDDNVIIIAQPLEQLTWSVKQYKAVTQEPCFVTQNKSFAKLSRKTREQNALTIWLDGGAIGAKVLEQMRRGGESEQVKLIEGIADFNSLQEVVASLSIEQDRIAVNGSVGFKEGHRCFAYDLIRTPNLERSGLKAVPAEAVAMVSLSLSESPGLQAQKAKEAAKRLTGLDIGREVFANIKQLTLYALPPKYVTDNSGSTKNVGPLSTFALAITSEDSRKTQQLLTELLKLGNLVARIASEKFPDEKLKPGAEGYYLGTFEGIDIRCYLGSSGNTTILSLSPHTLEASVKALKSGRSVLTGGPLKPALDELTADTSKLVLINAAGAIQIADSFINWKFDNPENPGHKLLSQLAQACEKTTLKLQTRETHNNFALQAGIEELPVFNAVFALVMQLSQIELDKKMRATEPQPSDGSVVGISDIPKLVWGEPGMGAVAHKIYFGTNPEKLKLLAEVEENVCENVPALEKETTYYWRVDEVQKDGSVIQGNVWSFNTGKLVAWWKFDETSGMQVNDSSGSGYHGKVVMGKPVWDPEGKFDGCLNFDETYGISIPREVFSSIDNAITITVWVNGNENQPNHRNVILQAGAGSRGRPYIITIETAWQENGEVRFETGPGGRDRVEYNASLEQWAGSWNHYAFVKDADKGVQKIYINGRLVAEEKGTTARMSGVDAARIGIAPDRFGDQYIRKLDDLRIYNYVLTQEEIEALCPMPAASGPKPRNRAVVAPTEKLELSWRPGTNATRHKVYIGRGPKKLGLLGETKYPLYETLAEIEPGATYYWRVDEVQADGSIVSGDVWSFSVGKLIGWWQFDEGSGTRAVDSSGSGHHGELKNMEDSDWVEGMIETALDFDGLDDCVQTTLDIEQSGTTSITMAAWVYPYNISPGRHQVISSDNGFWDWSLLREGSKWCSFTGDGLWNSEFDVDLNKWQHVAVVFKLNEDVVFYKNGKSRSKGTAPDTEASDNKIAIGDNPGEWDEYFTGRIDDVRIYNYALREGEIQDIYEKGSASF